jgi:hypothetical protein
VPGRFESWLCGIAASLARSRWQQRARAPLSLDGLAPGAAAREPALLVRLRVEIDREGLVDACHALVTGPSPDRFELRHARLRGRPSPATCWR